MPASLSLLQAVGKLQGRGQTFHIHP